MTYLCTLAIYHCAFNTVLEWIPKTLQERVHITQDETPRRVELPSAYDHMVEIRIGCKVRELGLLEPWRRGVERRMALLVLRGSCRTVTCSVGWPSTQITHLSHASQPLGADRAWSWVCMLPDASSVHHTPSSAYQLCQPKHRL